MNNEQTKQRILNGIEYYWSKKPSQFSMLDQRHFVEFLKLLKLFLNGEKINSVKLKEEAKFDPVIEARKLFKEETPVA